MRNTKKYTVLDKTVNAPEETANIKTVETKLSPSFFHPNVGLDQNIWTL